MHYLLKNFDENFLKGVIPFFHLLFKYHRYEVKGLEHIPRTSPIIICVNHSFATYDGLLLGAHIYLNLGRSPCGLADNNLFCTETVKEWSHQFRLAEANHQNAEKLLVEDGEMLMLAPGGMREALKPTKTLGGKVLWDKRMGFAKLAIKTQIPVIVAACPHADKIFDVYPNFFTKLVYKKFKLPFVFLKGLGFSLIPRPVKLVHYISKPIMPPPYSANTEEFNQSVVAYHRQVVEEMNRLMEIS